MKRPWQFVFKIAGRCNINCSYCYMYNLGDDSILKKPKIMDIHTFSLAVGAISRYQKKYSIQRVGIAFHGGEPLMVGPNRFNELCRIARNVLGPSAVLAIQTNGILLNRQWIEVLERHRVLLGISLDGPSEFNDTFRVDHRARGTYSAAERGLRLAQSAHERDGRANVSIISVIDPTRSPKEYYDWVVNVARATQVSVLPPDVNHDNFAKYCNFSVDDMAAYLISLFNIWWNANDDISIRLFDSIIGMIMGGTASGELVGSIGAVTVVIDTDGEIQSHDVVRTCGEFDEKKINVASVEIEDIFKQKLYRELNPTEMEVSSACRQCQVFRYCKGGFISHRFSTERRFSNPSVYCSVWFSLISHIYFVIMGLQSTMPEDVKSGISA